MKNLLGYFDTLFSENCYHIHNITEAITFSKKVIIDIAEMFYKRSGITKLFHIQHKDSILNVHSLF